jgi:hypothetical protein
MRRSRKVRPYISYVWGWYRVLNARAEVVLTTCDRDVALAFFYANRRRLASV